MNIRTVMNRSLAVGASVVAMAVAGQFFVSCGGNYEKPSTTQTESALIPAETLRAWMAAGKVNGAGYDRVVILDVSTSANYAAGHIPGALFLDPNDLSQSRTEGVGISGTEVLEGSKMDALIQKYGIDGGTTVVFSGSSSPSGFPWSMMNPSRAYFVFRYWGFPKSRLKLLDGLNASWTSGLTTDPSPSVAQSTYSVKNNRALRSDLRVSLSEMIDYADGKIPGVLPIDVRSAATGGSYAGVRGSTTGLYSTVSGTASVTDVMVFEGRIRGAQALLYSSLYNGSYMFNPTDQLIASFTAIGLDSTKTAYVYCRVGNLAAIGFFVLDGILGWPTAVYDGSWSQWGQLSGNASMKGQLSAASPWRTDIAGRSDLIVYNYESISAVTFSGTGTNDLVTGGLYTSGTTSTFTVQIDFVGTPDTFKWTGDGGSTWATGIPITGSAQLLVSGLTVSFGSTGGHALDDSWTFTARARKNVEQLTADGTTCSATYLANGAIANSTAGTTACTNSPASFDTGANRVEEADKAYIKSGGSGGGGGGGSVPTGC